jgi:hypothetical protein
MTSKNTKVSREVQLSLRGWDMEAFSKALFKASSRRLEVGCRSW